MVSKKLTFQDAIDLIVIKYKSVYEYADWSELEKLPEIELAILNSRFWTLHNLIKELSDMRVEHEK